MILRTVSTSDAVSMADIYADAVLHGFGTFEEEPPEPGELWRRAQSVLALDLPWLVAQADGRMLGYAYAAPFRPRAAYRYTAEDSVYVASNVQGRGVGRALLTAVIQACEEKGLRRLVAAIGDSGNVASIRLHETCGFQRAGLLPSAGHKHGRWVDVVFMQRALGSEDGAAPAQAGLSLEGG